jgi:hypothetical protein
VESISLDHYTLIEAMVYNAGMKFQFSLRRLFIAVALLAIGIGVLVASARYESPFKAGMCAGAGLAASGFLAFGCNVVEVVIGAIIIMALGWWLI